MTVHSRRRRPGMTLMEVLIATFILAIGIVAIMALFPIGAVNMARAINQDRSATHGVNSDAVFRYYWTQAWNDPNGGTVRGSSMEAYNNSQEPVLVWLQSHPMYGPPVLPAPGVPIPGTSSQPSFVVMVDPVGHLTNTGNNQLFVAGNPQLPIRTTLRRCINYPTANPGPPPLIPGYSTANLSPLGVDPGFAPIWPVVPPNPPAQPVAYPQIIPAVIRLTTLPDDMTFARPSDGSNFATSGEPADFTGALDRGGRYNAAWIVQRPRNDVPSEVNVTVLVYAGRSPTDTPSAETAYPGTVVVPGEKTMVIPLAANQPAPALRRGGWIGFSQVVSLTQAATPIVPYPTLDFYRITAVNSDVPNQVILELETPIKVNGPPTQANGYVGAALVFDNLVEVFDRGTVSAVGVTR